MRGRLQRRLVRHHLALAALAGLLIVAIFAALRSPDPLFKLSMATGYVGLALLVLTLILGPLRVLRDRPSPVSTDLRRDVGIWAGLISLAHVLVGLQVHMSGRFWLYFLWPAEEWRRRALPLRSDLFGWANHVGLVASLLLLLLLALSNDLSLRRLGSKRWKTLQRLNYLLFILVAAHSVIYQQVEQREPLWTAVLAALVLVASVIQVAGFLRWKHRSPRPA